MTRFNVINRKGLDVSVVVRIRGISIDAVAMYPDDNGASCYTVKVPPLMPEEARKLAAALLTAADVHEAAGYE